MTESNRTSKAIERMLFHAKEGYENDLNYETRIAIAEKFKRMQAALIAIERIACDEKLPKVWSLSADAIVFDPLKP